MEKINKQAVSSMPKRPKFYQVLFNPTVDPLSEIVMGITGGGCLLAELGVTASLIGALLGGLLMGYCSYKQYLRSYPVSHSSEPEN